MLVKFLPWNALSSISVVPLGMMPSPFMILYFAIFLLTIAFVSRGGYIGDINSLKSYVTVVGGRLCSVDYFCFFARLRSSVTKLMKKSLKYHSATKIHVFSK